MVNHQFLFRRCATLNANVRNFSSSACNHAPPSLFITTFHPKLMEEKNQPISRIGSMPHVTWLLGSKLKPRFSHHLHYSIDYHPGIYMYRRPAFPPDIKGFFYFDQSMPPLSGSIRFRVCENLASFNDGHDLLTEMNEPWAIPFIRMARHKVWSNAVGYLIRDGQVTEAMVRTVDRLRLARKSLEYRPLFYLTQPFAFNLKHRCMSVHLLTTTSASRIDLQHLFYDADLERMEGCLKLAFELVTPEPADGPTLVLRILDILTPIQYPQTKDKDQIVKFEAGELLQRWHEDGPRPWTYNLATRTNGPAWLKFIRSTQRWCNK